jgi:hypothetical protein
MSDRLLLLPLPPSPPFLTPSLCAQIPSEERAKVFIPMFERFTKDASRWVRNGAFEVLGPFLHVLGPKLVRGVAWRKRHSALPCVSCLSHPLSAAVLQITKEMLRHYTTIPDLTNAVVDQEVTFFCAFNLPAVALTLGPDRWDGTSRRLIGCGCASVYVHITCGGGVQSWLSASSV